MKKIILPLLLLCISLGISAKSITLTPKGNNKDDRGAIMNALKKADTLYLESGTFLLKDEPLLINSFLPEKIVIVGKGMDQTIIKGSQKGAFVISNNKQAHHVSIKGLTISDASRNVAGTDKGGGIYADTRGGSLLLNDVAIRNCTALGGGGAIAISGVNTTIKNCCITDNKVTSENQYGGYGGAIYFYANTAYADETPEAILNIDNSLISKNESTNSGGGICIFGNAKYGEKMKIKLALSNSTIAYNKSGKNGGGIYVASYKLASGNGGNASAAIDNSTIAYNQATAKGGIGLGFGPTGFKPELDMTNTILSLNETSAKTGSAFDTDMGLAQISNFSNNKIGKAKGLTASNSYTNVVLNFFDVPNVDLSCKRHIITAQKNEPKVELIAATTKKKNESSVGIDYGGLLAQVLQSNMVVQQGKPFTLWGNAPKGQMVKVKADWTSEKSTEGDENGVWKLQIDVPVIQSGDFTPHSIFISSEQETQKFENILIGDVWFMGGQSNMTMSMTPFLPWHKGVLNHETEIAAANHPQIRLYKQPKVSADTPQYISSGTWEICTPETVAPFSGVSYYFAQKVFKETNIPIGIVLSALGAMSCQTFTPAETLQADKVLREKFWDTYTADPQMPDAKRPSHLYNGMINPFINLSIKGFGWYQGESNAGHRELYTVLNSHMIQAWRNKFNQGTLPFYFVQMTPYSWKSKDFYSGGYAFFREAQEKILDIVENTDMVSTMDAGEIDTVHPSDKKTVGERLAALALHHNYEKKGVYKGPKFEKLEIVGSKAIVHFSAETVGSGLNTKDGQKPLHFYIAGKDKIYYMADAVIRGNTVELTSKDVSEPIAVRYAFLTYPLTNLQNKEGFAAYPFRTDTWKDAKYNDAK